MEAFDAAATILLAVFGGLVAGVVIWWLQEWWQEYLDSTHPWPYYVTIRTESFLGDEFSATATVDVTNRMRTRAELSLEFSWQVGVVGPTDSVRVETSNEQVVGTYSFIPPGERRRYTVQSERGHPPGPPPALVIMDTKLRKKGLPAGPRYPLIWGQTQHLQTWRGHPWASLRPWQRRGG